MEKALWFMQMEKAKKKYVSAHKWKKKTISITLTSGHKIEKLNIWKKGENCAKKWKRKKELLLYLSWATSFIWVCEEMKDIRWGQQICRYERY